MPSLKTLRGPADQNLEVLGFFTGQLTFQGNMVQGELYVVKGLKINLLGLPSITISTWSRDSAQRRWKVETAGNISHRYSWGWVHLGWNSYQIKLSKTMLTPYALYAPRNVPIPLHPKKCRKNLTA